MVGKKRFQRDSTGKAVQIDGQVGRSTICLDHTRAPARVSFPSFATNFFRTNGLSVGRIRYVTFHVCVVERK